MTQAAAQIDLAVERLRAGRLVAFPTETVYGLGADAHNVAALAEIFRAKGRPPNHPLIVHLARDADLSAWTTDLPPLAVRLIERFWPGPLTLILKRAPSVPAEAAGGQDTIGLRCPDHPLALALLAAFNASAPARQRGIAGPSANRFGHVSPTTAAHVAAEFPGEDIYILDGGACLVGIESTILDVSRLDGPAARPVLLRPGAIAAELLAEVIGEVPGRAGVVAGQPRVSGSLAAHYAPRTPMTLLDGAHLSGMPVDDQVAVWSFSLAPRGKLWRVAPAEASAYARQLYARLRELDQLGASHILIERPPSGPDWVALHDRLGRAETGSGF
jgi:L-threonylcarbamoyladenylate synthase